MDTFAKGDVILAPIAYSDGSGGKLYLAVIVATR